MARQPQPPRASIDEQLAALDALPAERAAKIDALQRALRGSHYRVAAKAARLAEDALLYELVPSILDAYSRFLDKPLKTDPSCFAKKAIARALVALDCNDTEFYRRGLQYRQLEPVWGGTADTAVDVRASCAMGLVASGYSRALVELTALLYDPDAAARVGAVRAIACGNPREAELLLRSKVHGGDAEPQVLGECFSGLLDVEPEESIGLVAGYLAHPDEAVRELAALALGESRLDGALAPLQEAWNQPVARQRAPAFAAAGCRRASQRCGRGLAARAGGGGARRRCARRHRGPCLLQAPRQARGTTARRRPRPRRSDAERTIRAAL